MPKLPASNEVEITLPSSTTVDPAIVTLDLTLTTKQALDIAGKEDKTQAMIGLIAQSVKAWNFVDDTGSTEPINDDTVGRLQLEDFTLLAETISRAVDKTLGGKRVGVDEKKA